MYIRFLSPFGAKWPEPEYEMMLEIDLVDSSRPYATACTQFETPDSSLVSRQRHDMSYVPPLQAGDRYIVIC